MTKKKKPDKTNKTTHKNTSTKTRNKNKNKNKNKKKRNGSKLFHEKPPHPIFSKSTRIEFVCIDVTELARQVFQKKKRKKEKRKKKRKEGGKIEKRNRLTILYLKKTSTMTRCNRN